MLHVNDLTYRIDGRLLLEKATAAIPAGHKVGFVGRNGSGKTTLLRLIQGEIHAESGSVSYPKRAKVGAVAQEAPSSSKTLLETVLEADKERFELLKEAETATDPARISDIQLRLIDIGAHAAPARAATILSGLGFDTEAQARPCSEFSGGWRMRVALAAVLFAEPDLLLLDEPTNYLDLEGTIWLENYLRAYPHTVLLVSHDRNLLNKAVDHILHLDGKGLKVYGGGYDYFERTRRMQQELQMKMKAKQEVQRKHMESFVERFRYKATKAKQAQSRLKAIARLEPIASVTEERTIPFNFPNPSEMRSPIVRLEGTAVGYEPGKPILKDINLRIDMDDRIALLGANGNGKSTFAKLIAGRLGHMDGYLRRSKKLEIAYFAQHQLDELNPEETPYDHFRALMGSEATIAQVRARAGAAGFSYEKADVKVKLLSGGEKARLLLAIATFKGPHILILDEPTNHLDVDSREALIHAINEYEGCVVLISHDRHLVETCADRLWLVADGTVKPYVGDLDDYQNLLLGRPGSPDAVEGPRKPKPVNERQKARRTTAELRKVLIPMRERVRAAEKLMARLEEDQAKIENALAIPNIYNDQPERAARFAKKRAELGRLLEDAEEEWLKASEALQEAEAELG
ncbi:MAG: ABC transporter ATP-binding protein [Alphaproteobacteria bacterium]|nr:MAG: ABC transporter ATP-binding protein [Alphaproteobacteria bacterium]